VYKRQESSSLPRAWAVTNLGYGVVRVSVVGSWKR
jgi:hypothetical protein